MKCVEVLSGLYGVCEFITMLAKQIWHLKCIKAQFLIGSHSCSALQAIKLVEALRTAICKLAQCTYSAQCTVDSEECTTLDAQSLCSGRCNKWNFSLCTLLSATLRCRWQTFAQAICSVHPAPVLSATPRCRPLHRLSEHCTLLTVTLQCRTLQRLSAQCTLLSGQQNFAQSLCTQASPCALKVTMWRHIVMMLKMMIMMVLVMMMIMMQLECLRCF